MTRRYEGGGRKDSNGCFLPPERVIIGEPGTLEEINEVIILALGKAVKKLAEKVIEENDVSREVIGALKDCEGMHRELAKKEKELLAGLSTEDLEKLANTQFRP
jgi:hypothetical protein